MGKSGSDDSAQLLQEIDQKMSIIESILQQISGDWMTEKVYNCTCPKRHVKGSGAKTLK